jgi:CheY-like chemotaxis protein
MPGMNGDELAARRWKQDGGPPVLVAVTARDDEQCQSRIRAAGLAPHPVKPVDPSVLLAAVTTAAEAHGPAG